MTNLADALLNEQTRVRELITMYRDPILKGSGEIAARMMEESLQSADRAVMSGDVLSMIHCLEDLKGFEC